MKILMFTVLMMALSSGMKAEVLLDDNDDKDLASSGIHNYTKNGLSISYIRSAQVVNITFNSSCDDVKVVIYKDGVPVDDDNIGSVDAGTTETYSVGGCENGNVSVSVITDGKEVWVSNIGKTE